MQNVISIMLIIGFALTAFGVFLTGLNTQGVK